MGALEGAVVLVTGANGGLGREFVAQALAGGAAKVYASARRPQEWGDPRVVPLALDVTDAASVASAAASAPDVTVVVNNAGVSPRESSLLKATDAELREIFDTNFFGAVAVARAFAPALAAAEGTAALIDLHSALSWHAMGGTYSTTKAALWSATNALRLELAPQGVQVIGVHVGWVDTPMAAGVDSPKVAPADVVAQTYSALETGEYEVLVDDLSVRLKAGLAAPIDQLYRGLPAPAGR
ncbi:SDR family oxidoreductase [Microbacterium sp. AZCO]|uniref:SDR family oxidoreductase n=1 Tax=Microbacterium sp. AZCO TaxID=3142976 RepID=UPI0031F3E739